MKEIKLTGAVDFIRALGPPKPTESPIISDGEFEELVSGKSPAKAPGKITAEQILKELGEALKRFGTYSFDDKGSEEVMDYTRIVSSLRAMPAEEAREVLLGVSRSPLYDGRAETLALQLVCGLQDSPDDWWEVLMEAEELRDF